MLERLRYLPVPMRNVRSRQWEGAIQAKLFRNVWDQDGAELVYYWPASAGPLPVNSSAANPGLTVLLNGTDAANYTVRPSLQPSAAEACDSATHQPIESPALLQQLQPVRGSQLCETGTVQVTARFERGGVLTAACK